MIIENTNVDLAQKPSFCQTPVTGSTGLNVLSLFDGMSCGQIALQRAGIKVENYFASEIDKYAIQVTKHNYPNTKHIGDVTKVKGTNLPKIDLLIGGSPCQGFSFAGKQLNFDDPRSKLFFEFVRLKNECNPTFFLLENVKMKKEYQDVITEHLGVEPIEINSNLLSAQNRKRIYWTNVPIGEHEPKNILIQDILQNDMPRECVTDKISKYVFSGEYAGRKIEKTTRNSIRTPEQKSRTIGTCSYDISSNAGICFKIGDEYYKPNQVEFERLQTLPDGYTSVLPIKKAVFGIGNGWTVDVIVHILKYLAESKD